MNHLIFKNYQFNYELNYKSDKPLILFLHGFMGNLDEFDEAIHLLNDEFSYLKIDLPGHGKTQVLADDEYYTMANTAQGIIKILDKLQIKQCFLVGYSLGGRLALYLTLYFSERFLKVILESASPGLVTKVQRLSRSKSDAQIARKLTRISSKHDFADFLLNWYNQPIFGAIKNHPKFESMLENRLKNRPLELVNSLQFMGTGSQPSLWEQLKDNQIPLLLLVGEHDHKFTEINMDMAKISSVATLKVIANAAHNIHLENTWEFVKNIQEFFTNTNLQNDTDSRK